MTALKWRFYYVDESVTTPEPGIITIDNTQSEPENLPKTHAIWLNQLIENDTDTDRLFGSDYFLWLPTRKLWTLADISGKVGRNDKGTAYIGIEGIQTPTPDYRKIAYAAMTDKDFPNAIGFETLDQETKGLVSALIEREVELRMATRV